MNIKSIFARNILNSAGAKTIETKITLNDGSFGISSVPGGISKGKNEVVSIDPSEAIKNVTDISEKLISRQFISQKEFDEFLIELDGTSDKSNIGGNAMLSLSIAFCKACSKKESLETFQYLHNIHNPEKSLGEAKFFMPRMMMLMLEGGLHGSGGATIQEFMAIVDNIDRGVEIYKSIKSELNKLGQSTNVGAEGAFSPNRYDNDQILSLLNGYLHGEKIALDIAATSFVESGWGPIDYDVLLGSYPIESIEDPFAEDDWANWEVFGREKLSNIKNKIMIVTDDLTTTNPLLLEKAISREVGNAILVKPNQIGTVTETLKVIKIAQNNTWKIVVSHRGTDTNDDFIADLAVGTGAEFVKFGAPARGERVAKYNRLLEIIG